MKMPGVIGITYYCQLSLGLNIALSLIFKKMRKEVKILLTQICGITLMTNVRYKKNHILSYKRGCIVDTRNDHLLLVILEKKVMY